MSSAPISILEFTIAEFPSFNSYSETKKSFEVTHAENSTMSIGMTKPIKYLKPVFTIDPYTSIRGYIFFWSGIERDIDLNKKIALSILTSRKTFKTNIEIKSKYDSIKKHGNISRDEEGNLVQTFY